eukprot:6486107-Ditylum_brightwellii.AAC.1
MDQAHKMAETSELDFRSNFSITSGKRVGVLFTQQSTQKARKGAVLDAAIGGGEDAKDCGDFFHGEERMVCWKPTGLCKEIHQ